MLYILFKSNYNIHFTVESRKVNAVITVSLYRNVLFLFKGIESGDFFLFVLYTRNIAKKTIPISEVPIDIVVR